MEKFSRFLQMQASKKEWENLAQGKQYLNESNGQNNDLKHTSRL